MGVLLFMKVEGLENEKRARVDVYSVEGPGGELPHHPLAEEYHSCLLLE